MNQEFRQRGAVGSFHAGLQQSRPAGPLNGRMGFRRAQAGFFTERSKASRPPRGQPFQHHKDILRPYVHSDTLFANSEYVKRLKLFFPAQGALQMADLLFQLRHKGGDPII
ncbi:MAG TPA: hypothetical protein P5204_11105 [Kiritimatiellia bacterium]|nr:hypothetical protein [Kiritimatiellia bacterium]